MSKSAFRPTQGLVVALFISAWTTGPARADFPLEEKPEVCGEYGTTVVFADSPAEAAKQALKEEKLVFVLHVSGHFEESDYT